MAITNITPLPTPPTRQDPANFAQRADTFLAALPTFTTEVNTAGDQIEAAEQAAKNAQIAAENAANAAARSSDSASVTANAAVWVSGSAYSQYSNAIDPVDYRTYRAKNAVTSATRPALDSTNWALLSAQGDVTTNTDQTITSVKTFTQPIVGSTTTQVLKAGDTMTGHLSVPAGASGAQVPRRSEVVGISGGESIGGVKTFTSRPKVPSGATLDEVPQAQEVAMLATTQLGFRNKVINGNFTVNQDAVSGTVQLAAGAYGHDQWKAGSSGCTYTFAASDGVTTLTITAGSLIQPLEGLHLQTGTYTLSWTGTAQGKIGAGAYGASGQTASVTGGADLDIEFGTGTLALVQFELGKTPTPFEHRPLALEALLCYRYYVVLSADDVNKLGAFGRKYSNNQDYLNVSVQWPTRMRVSPTLVETGTRASENINAFALHPNQVGFTNLIGASTANSVRAYNFGIKANARM